MSFTDENWHRRMQGASDEIDTRFGEQVVVFPAVRKPNFAATRSGDPAYYLTAVFSYRSVQVFAKDGTTKHMAGTVIQSRKPIISFSHRQSPFALQIGDFVKRLVDSTHWQVTSVAPDGVSRITAELTNFGVASQ